MPKTLSEMFVRLEPDESEEELAKRYPDWVVLGIDPNLSLRTCAFGYRYAVLARED